MNPISAAYGVAVTASWVTLRRVEGAWKAARLASIVRRSGASPSCWGGWGRGAMQGSFRGPGLAASGLGGLRLWSRGYLAEMVRRGHDSNDDFQPQRRIVLGNTGKTGSSLTLR